MRFLISGFLLATCFAVSFAGDTGSSAIITLVMPPPGGEGYDALQAGGALAQGAASLYFNPALLADLNRATGSQLFYSHSQQNLLPALGMADLHQEFWSGAGVLPDPVSGTDMAVGYFRNRVDFGENYQTDANGMPIGLSHPYETVQGLGVAMRLCVPISIGLSAKFIDSHLSDGFTGVRPAYGWAFDLGMVANPRLSPATDLGFPHIVIMPSFALIAHNLGPDVFYGDARQADPIPTTYSAAYGWDVDIFDLAELQAGADMDHEWTHRSENWRQIRNLGYSCFLMGFRYSAVWLDDPAGDRFEKHTARSLEIDARRAHRIFRRLSHWDFFNDSGTMDRGYPIPSIRIAGVPFLANPRLELGYREIQARGGGIREGQESRYYLGLSL